MGKFSTKTITSRQHGYPELQSKAWNVTGMHLVFWMFFCGPKKISKKHNMIFQCPLLIARQEFVWLGWVPS